MDALLAAAASAAQACGLSAQARSVLAVLAAAASVHEPAGDPSCWLSTATIRSRTGVSTRTVSRQLAVLTAAGLTSSAGRRRDPDTGNWAPTIRWLRVDRICKLADERHARILTAAVAEGRERSLSGAASPLPAAAAAADPIPAPEKEHPMPAPQPAADPGDGYYATRPAQVTDPAAPEPASAALNWAGLIDTGRASGASKTETLAAASIAAGVHLDTLRTIHDQATINRAADVLAAWERLRATHPRSPLSTHDRDTAAAPWEARCLANPDPAAYANLLPDAARRYAANTEPRYQRSLARWLNDGCTQWVSHDSVHPSARTLTDTLAPTDAPIATPEQARAHLSELRAIIAGVGRTA